MTTATRLAALFRRSMDAAELTRSRHVSRGLAGLLMAAAVAAFVASAAEDDAPGRTLLVCVVWVNGLVLLAGVTGLFGSIVSEERAAGTLPLLKLSDTSEPSILAGLAGPRLFALASLLAVQVPFAILSMTLGGVTVTQVLGCYATLGLGSLLWSAAVTLAACLTRTASAAVGASLGLLIAAVAAPPEWVFGEGFVPRRTLEGILDGKRDWPSRSFVAGTLTGAFVLSLAAWSAFLRTPLTSERIGVRRRSRLGRVVVGVFGRRPRVPNTESRRGPHAWKSFQFVTGGRAGWWLRVLTYVTAGAAVWWSGWQTSPPIAVIAVVSGVLLPIDVAWLAARRVRMEVEANAWQTLELLPSTYSETIGGTTDGTVRGATAGIVVLAVAILLETGRHGLVFAYVAAAIGAGVFLAFYGPLLAVCWTVGTRLAMRLPATYAAAATAVSVVLFGAGMLLTLRLAGVIGALLLAGLMPMGFIYLCVAAGNTDRLLERFMSGVDQSPFSRLSVRNESLPSRRLRDAT